MKKKKNPKEPKKSIEQLLKQTEHLAPKEKPPVEEVIENLLPTYSKGIRAKNWT